MCVGHVQLEDGQAIELVKAYFKKIKGVWVWVCVFSSGNRNIGVGVEEL